MRTFRRFVPGLLLMLASPAAGAAQDAPVAAYRDGFWIGFGLAAGHAQLNCGVCSEQPAGDPWRGGLGGSGYLAAGGTPRPNLLVGGEVSVYFRESETTEREAVLGTVSLIGQYYPGAASRLFIKGGLGLGYWELVDYYYLHSFMGRTSSAEEGSGYSAQVGVGYDFVIFSRYALVPHVNVVQLFASGAAHLPANPRYLQIGVALHRY
jgi:hypothetical protein